MIHSNFAGLIGQNRAKTVLSAGIMAAKNGRPLMQPFVTAPKGTGKTEILNRYLDALQDEGFRILRYNSPADIRLEGNGWEEFKETVLDFTNPYAIMFDEAHEAWEEKTKNMRLLTIFLRKALDKTNIGREIVLQDDMSTYFDRSKHVICMATNEPQKIDEAVVDRFDKIELELFSEVDLRSILKTMLIQENIKVENELVIQLIANCGRGTARPIRNIVDQINTCYGNSKPITLEQALFILRLMNIFPKGLTKLEVNLLQMANNNIIRDAQFLATFPAMDAKTLRFSKGFLSSPEIGFLVQTSRGGMETTKRGKAYLKLIEEKGFLTDF